MSLPHILLGMLREPASGYDLKQRFGESVAHFWSAELSQIYPTLNRLEKQGLLTSRKEPSDKGPPRKVYRRTPAGRRELKAWLGDGPHCRQERLTFLTQVFFLANVTTRQRIRFFEDLKADFEAHLAELQAIEAGWCSEDPRYPDDLPDEDFYPQLTLRLGLMKYRTIIDWCEECLRRIRARE